MKEILLVEDDRTLNRMVSGLLRAEGYFVTSAYTAGWAPRIISPSHFPTRSCAIKYMPSSPSWTVP